jgi:HlyD family secretion protein
MKRRFRIGIIAVVIIAAGVAGMIPVSGYWRARNRQQYRTAEVTRGTVIEEVNCTGTVKPVLSIQVGSFVSGPIDAVLVDFNEHVKVDQLMAKIDDRLFQATVKRDNAFLATNRADLQRAQALVKQAENDEKRAKALRAINEDYISDAEMDRFRFNREALEAQVKVAEAAVDSALANLQNSEQNLEYTNIKSTVDGIVVDKIIVEGQTLAAQFQTPEMFVVAPDMEKEIHVFASVDEADIGLIRKAQDEGQPVRFTVDAYPDDLFEGKIAQVRMSSTLTENVVTYPVVVSTSNPDLKLMPGMTASVSFQVGMQEDVIKIPNSALRFYPEEVWVHPDDRALFRGEIQPEDEDDAATATTLSAREKAAASRRRSRRHVWIEEGEYLRAVEVTTGLVEGKFAELKSGDLKEGQMLVTGIDRRPQ